MSSVAQRSAAHPAYAKVEKQYKFSLVRRWFDFVWRTAVFSGFVTAVSTFSITWKASTVLFGLVGGIFTFPFTLYPILAARRAYITTPGKSVAKASPISLFTSSVTASRSVWYLATHVIFSAGFALVYTQIISFTDDSVDFGILRPTPRHPLHLNERVAFLLWGNVCFFTLLGLVDVLKSRTTGQWPKKRTPLFVAAQKGLDEGLGKLLELIPIFGLSSWSFTVFAPAFSILYWQLRRRVWYFAAKWGLSSFVINWARSSKTNLSVGLVAYLYALIVASLVLFRLPTAIMNAYITQAYQPLSFAGIKSPLTPDRYLLEGLKSKDPYFLHFTLMELLRVSYDPARRAKIFNEPTASPNARTVLVLEIWQELLLHFGAAYKTLATRNGAVVTRGTPLPTRPSGPDPRAIQVKQADVFRPVVKQKSTIGLALQNVLDGPVKPTPPAVVNAEQAVIAAESKALKQVEGVAKEAMKRLEGYERGKVVVKETQGIIESIFTWSGQQWARKNVQTSVPEPMVVDWILDIFATLAVASADEDQFGYVQSVMPATLEAIVRYRSALLGLESELQARARTIGRGGEPAAAEVRKLIGETFSACDRAVLRIGERFGKSLSAFKFPPGVAGQLGEICRPLETVEEE